MFGLLFLLLIVVPLAELYVIVQVASAIGGIETIALLLLVSIAGAYLLKREGLATWQKVRAATAAGKMPTKELTDGAMIILGGALLLTPGFITDAVGASLVLPPTRAALKGVFRKVLKGWALGRVGTGARTGYRIYETTARRRDRRANANEDLRNDPPGHPRQEQLPPAEEDSRDKD